MKYAEASISRQRMVHKLKLILFDEIKQHFSEKCGYS